MGVVAVKLDDEFPGGPVEVDLEATDRHVDGGWRKPVGAAELDEAVFEDRTGLGGGAILGDKGSKPLEPAAACRLVAEVLEVRDIQQPEPVGFVEGSLELSGREDAGYVEESARGGGHGNRVALAPLAGTEERVR